MFSPTSSLIFPSISSIGEADIIPLSSSEHSTIPRLYLLQHCLKHGDERALADSELYSYGVALSTSCDLIIV
jgi:hypothetical protein